ncbi:MAG: TaqI-like C-terminal specificity domain-containing protein [Synergistaceae bacterium]
MMPSVLVANKYIIHKSVSEKHQSSNTEDFLNKCLKVFPQLDTKYKRVHSGLFIPSKYKDIISSLKVEGNYVGLDTNKPTIEFLIIKSTINSKLEINSSLFEEFVFYYMKMNSLDAVFALVTSPVPQEPDIEYFITSPVTPVIAIPNSIINSTCKNALNLFISDRLNLSIHDVDSFFSDEYLLFDDTQIKSKLKEIDALLSNFTFCDIYAETTSLILSLEDLVIKYRMKINSYMPPQFHLSKKNIIKNFFSNTLYFTNFSQDKLLLVKLELLAMVNFDCTVKFNSYCGNILTSNLFNTHVFDLIITLPPHVRFERFSSIKNAFDKFSSYKSNPDLYCYYIERAFSLLKQNGIFSSITTDRWMTSKYGSSIRSFLLTKSIISLNILDIASTSPSISNSISRLIVKNSPITEKFTFSRSGLFEGEEEVVSHFKINPDLLTNDSWLFNDNIADKIISKIKSNSVSLYEYTDNKIFRGILTGLNKAFVVDKNTYEKLSSSYINVKDIIHKFLSGREIKRYLSPINTKYLIAFPKGYTNTNCGDMDACEWITKNFPSIMSHLSQHEKQATIRSDKGDYWWELRSCKYYNYFSKTKIICPMIVKKLSATMDSSLSLSNDKTLIIGCDDFFILGLLNSSLFDFYFRHIAKQLLNDHYELSATILGNMPIKNISKTSKKNKELRMKIADISKELSSLHDMYALSKSTSYKEQIYSKEKEINSLVFSLYKLLPSEIKYINNN